MNKKILSFLIVILTVIALSGCQGSTRQEYDNDFSYEITNSEGITLSMGGIMPLSAGSSSVSKTLTATVLPVTATNKAVDWSCEWDDTENTLSVSDYVTVMRDGKHIATKPVSEVEDRSELIKMMIGKSIVESYIPKESQQEDVLLEIKNLSNEKLKDISFNVKRGEIVGFYGLVGGGKTELALSIFGAERYTGEIIFKGKKLGTTPAKAIEAGIALVPEERRTQGIFTILTIRNNIPVMNMKKISNGGFIDAGKEKQVAVEYIDKLRIVTSGPEKETAKLSGGNQQKLVFAKCLFADSDLLILDEPTRGIDVGAKSEIYSIVRELAESGKSIMFLSSELPEILNLCDRIFLLFDGEIKAELINGTDIDSQKIIHIVTGGE